MRFSDSLDRKLEDIKRPPNPPVGHYIWQILEHPAIEEFESRNTGEVFDRLSFQVAIVEPSEDVDTDELAEYGKVQGFRSRKTFLFSTSDETAYKRSEFNARRFLGHCGVSEDMSMSEALAASVGQQFLGELKTRPDPNDPEIVYAELGTTAEL